MKKAVSEFHWLLAGGIIGMLATLHITVSELQISYLQMKSLKYKKVAI
jgi:hypothetical protein